MVPTPEVSLRPVAAEDAEALAALRVAAMEPSLRAVGRFDAQRARLRFLDGFEPRFTRAALAGPERVGFLVVRPVGDAWLLDHLYILPAHQGRSYGSQILRRIFDEADAAAMPLRVGALKQSRANAFYLRHGFMPAGSAEWDVYYLRAPRPPSARVR